MTTDLPAATPHDDLVRVFDDVWTLKGSVDFKPLVRLQRNMVVLRSGSELTLINAIRLDDAGLEKLDALGTVAHVVKIGVHGMDDAFYLDRNGAQHWVAPGMDTPGEARLLAETDLPHPDLSLFVFEHTKNPEAALLHSGDGGLLITCDSVQHWEPSDLMSTAAKLVTSVMGFKHPAQIGPPWRKVMTPDGGTLRPDFDRLVALPFVHLVGAHGGLCRDEAKARLQDTITRVYGAAPQG
jgi:hypothetical protein